MPVLPLVGSTINVSSSDQALLFGIVDHGRSDAVLDAAQRIEKFQLGGDLRPEGFPPVRFSRTRGVRPMVV